MASLFPLNGLVSADAASVDGEPRRAPLLADQVTELEDAVFVAASLNHAVGDGTGWFFDWKANASAANYSAWAANRTFYLGDYLSEFKLDRARS